MSVINLFIFATILVLTQADKFAQIEENENPNDPNKQVVNEDGSYQYQYKTSNDIYVQESGIGGVIAQGAAQWFAPDGLGVQFTYRADTNGYQPEGNQLPTPPPTPDYILRALEYQKLHPWVDEWTNKAVLKK